MRPAWLWLLGAGILASAHGQPPHVHKHLEVALAPNTQQSETTPAYHKITPTITSLALRLYQHLVSGRPGNVFFSPVSISTTLAMMALGSQANISTQILESLGFNLTETPEADIHRGFQSLLHTLALPSPKLELKVGNALFLDKQLPPPQLAVDRIRELYGVLTLAANFTDAAATQRQMNQYVRKQTYGQVGDWLQELSPDTPLVLLNYIFFKAKWKQPFHLYQTQKPGRFLVNGKTSTLIPMMHQKVMHRFFYDQDLACMVLQIEFSGNALALFILPDPGKMSEVEAALQPETLRKWNQFLMPSLLDLHLPRFAISGAYNLEEILPHLGLINIFNTEADLLGIIGQLNKTISRVSHKATVDMSERGTEAGAASGLLSQPQSQNTTWGGPAHFNRPFLLLLWEVTTQSLLFLGKVVEPATG
ncbi:serpin A11-like [Suncus etruscus]|uniref:serpin A11-like n=1 Tax=Suncus etruscus TaxID=109475 RepID=UPI00210FAF5D|nr:serpin A11-like [Suncus etruscus]